MSIEAQALKAFRSSLQDLADQETSIHAKRKQLFDQLVAECGDDRLARRVARIAFYAVQRKAMLRRFEQDLEFLFEDDPREVEDDDFDAEGAA